LIYQAMIKTT